MMPDELYLEFCGGRNITVHITKARGGMKMIQMILLAENKMFDLGGYDIYRQY